MHPKSKTRNIMNKISTSTVLLNGVHWEDSKWFHILNDISNWRRKWCFLQVMLGTSNCLKVSISIRCFCLSSISWFCKDANSFLIISSLSWIADSLTPSFISCCLNLSVETATSSTGAINSLLDILGNISFTACNASIHAILSSLVSALRCSLFVPVKIENLLSSDLLSRMDET